VEWGNTTKRRPIEKYENNCCPAKGKRCCRPPTGNANFNGAKQLGQPAGRSQVIEGNAIHATQVRQSDTPESTHTWSLTGYAAKLRTNRDTERRHGSTLTIRDVRTAANDAE